MLKIKPSANAIRKSVAAIVRGTPAVIMMGKTIDPTMMTPPSPESEVKSSATIRAKRQREQQRLFAAVLGREVDDRARDAGFNRNAAQQRTENHRDVNRRERIAPPVTISPSFKAGTPATSDITIAMAGTATSAGSHLQYIATAKTAKTSENEACGHPSTPLGGHAG